MDLLADAVVGLAAGAAVGGGRAAVTVLRAAESRRADIPRDRTTPAGHIRTVAVARLTASAAIRRRESAVIVRRATHLPGNRRTRDAQS